MASMEEILTGSADKPAEPKEEPKVEKQEQEAAAEKSEAKPEEEKQEAAPVSTGEEASKGEKEAAPPAAGKTEHSIPIATLLDEREKRQNLERKLAEIEKAQTPPEEAPDFFDDPEAALKERERAFDEKILKNKLDMSQAMAMESHPDFNDVLKDFNDAMEKDPALMGRGKALWNESLSQPHPALFVYNAVKRELALRDISDPDELRKKIEAEVREKIKAETEAAAKEKEKSEAEAPGSIPESLADERSVGSRKGPEWTGPTPLGEIIKSA